jgi:hypothetical protein
MKFSFLRFPLRIPIPFTSRSIIFIDDPQQIDEVLSHPDFRVGIPKLVRFIINFKYTAGRHPKDAFVALSDSDADKKYHLCRRERIAMQKKVQFLGDDDVQILAEYLIGKRDRHETQHHLVCCIARNFVNATPPIELIALGDQMSTFLKSPYHYLRAKKARQKYISWFSTALENTSKYNPEISQKILGDIYHATTHFANRKQIFWNLIEYIKGKLHENIATDLDARKLITQALLLPNSLPLTARAAKTSCKLDTLPYKTQSGDLMVLLLGKAKETTQNLHYAFLTCCAQNFIYDTLLRATSKAITLLKPA